MDVREMTVEAFINATASSAPAPGGGGVAALNAASAAALIAMVANLTIGKEKYRDQEKEMKQIAAEAAALKDRFLFLIEADARAYTRVIAAYRLPRETEAQKAERKAAVQEALKGAALVPFQMGEAASGLFPLAEAVILRGNPGAVTDGAVAVVNIRSAVRSAFYNVKINLSSIDDASFVRALSEKIESIEKEAELQEQHLLGKVNL